MARRSWLGGFIAGVFISAIICVCVGAGTTMRGSWQKEQVVPVCPVKAEIGGFKPIYGNAIGNQWDKKEVMPEWHVNFCKLFCGK